MGLVRVARSASWSFRELRLAGFSAGVAVVVIGGVSSLKRQMAKKSARIGGGVGPGGGGRQGFAGTRLLRYFESDLSQVEKELLADPDANQVCHAEEI